MQRQWLWEMRTLQRVRDSMLQELRKLEDKADEADGSAAARMAVLKTDMAKIAVRRGMPPQPARFVDESVGFGLLGVVWRLRFSAHAELLEGKHCPRRMRCGSSLRST